MVVKDGVEFESLDGQPAHLFFLIAAPNTEDNVHLDVLSRLSVLLMDEDFTNKLRQAASVSEFKQIFRENQPLLLRLLMELTNRKNCFVKS